MRAIAIIQARSTSSRLPGKVLMEIDGQPILHHVIQAVQRMHGIDQVALAIPDGDVHVAQAAAGMDVTICEGSHHDVLDRFWRIVADLDADYCVRITADCPVLDSTLGSIAVDRALRVRSDYFTWEGFPRGTADIEVVSRSALELAHRHATSAHDREHVTPWIRRALEGSDREAVVRAASALHRPEFRVCIDELADLQAVRRLFSSSTKRPLDVAEVIRILEADPGIAHINAHISQRPI